MLADLHAPHSKPYQINSRTVNKKTSVAIKVETNHRQLLDTFISTVKIYILMWD